MSEIRYTAADGAPADFGLVDRWFQEPFDDTELKPDNREKIELIGEIIAAVSDKMAATDAAQALHVALIAGTIVASGRLSASSWSDKKTNVAPTFRARIPANEFSPLYESAHYDDQLIVFDDERGGWDNEWLHFRWIDSSLEYSAHGFFIDANGEEIMSFDRWSVSWTAIMISRREAMEVLGKINPALKPIIRPKPVRPKKSDAEIIAKADELHGNGFGFTEISKRIKFEPGFENVQNRHVRELISGRYPRTGRPKKSLKI